MFWGIFFHMFEQIVSFPSNQKLFSGFRPFRTIEKLSLVDVAYFEEKFFFRYIWPFSMVRPENIFPSNKIPFFRICPFSNLLRKNYFRVILSFLLIVTFLNFKRDFCLFPANMLQNTKKNLVLLNVAHFEKHNSFRFYLSHLTGLIQKIGSIKLKSFLRI